MLIHLIPSEPRTHHITLKAAKYRYSPARIVVNRGDKIVLKSTSLDVTHGLYLDGYPVEAVLKQKGITYLKYEWEDEEGGRQTDWDRVPAIEFVADRAGKFIYRCTRTCGNLHPFMTGELIVRPNTPYYLFSALSVWLMLSILLLISAKPDMRITGFKPVNLLKTWPWFKRLVSQRGFQFFLILPNFIVFYLFILSSLQGSPVGNRNIAIIFVWILWWFLLKAVFVPFGGRIWCTVCPLPAPGEWISRKSLTAVRYFEKPFRRLHHRFTGLEKDWPGRLDNIWLQNVLFLGLISFGIILITRPFATAMLFIAILGMTLVLSLVYRNRAFCQYLCPVGGFLGTYSMAAMTELRAVDPDVCREHRKKSCLQGDPHGWACPWNQYVGTMSRNNFCGLCMECVKSCPKDNVGVFIRPFGSDRRLKGYDEVFNVIIMLAVAIVFSITMLGPWGIIKDAANVTESQRLVPYLTYLVVIWSLALVILPGLFTLSVKGTDRLTGGRIGMRRLMLRLTCMLIPVGMFAWIAFSLPTLMVNYNYILSVLSDPLGLGWDIFGTADFPFQPFIPEWIPIIQGFVLLVGLYLGITRGFLTIRELLPDASLRAKAMLLPALFSIMVVNILYKLYLG